MKTIKLLLILLISFKCSADSCCDDILRIQFQPQVIQYQDGYIELSYNVIRNQEIDTLIIDSISYFIENNEGVVVEGNTLEGGIYENMEETTHFLNLSYDPSNPPFYLQEVRMYVTTNGLASMSIAYLHFTPWGTIEVFNSSTLSKHHISWISPLENDEEIIRVEIDPDTIPSSLPDTTLPTCWKYYEGLAYAVLVNCEEDTTQQPEWVKTFRGRALGRLTYTYRNEDGQTRVIPIANARIEAWSTYRIGVGSTDNNGNFQFNFDKTTVNWSGNIRVRLRFETRDNSGEVEVHYNSIVLGINNAYSMETSSKNFNHQSGNRHNLNFGTVNAGHHRNMHIFHWAKRSIEFAKSELHGLPIPWAKLLVYVPQSTSSTGGECVFRKNAPLYIGAPAQGKIRLTGDRCLEFESTTFHEVGHFVHFAIQNRRWVTNAGGTHTLVHNNKDPNQTVTEGFANAFAMMVDAYTFTDDLESFRYRNILIQPRGENLAFRVNLEDETHPFTASWIFARTLFDLWDDPSKFSNYGFVISGPLRDEINDFDGEILDEVSLTFKQIILPFFDNRFSNNTVIQDVAHYYHELTKKQTDCVLRGKVKKICEANFVHANYNGPGDLLNISTDEIYRNLIHPHQNDNLSVNSAGFAVAGTPTPNPHTYSISNHNPVDMNELTTATGSYNNAIGVIGNNNLSDDLTLSGNSDLHFNRNIPIGWVNSNSTARPPIPSVMQSDLCDITLTVLNGSSIIIGDQSVDANASVNAGEGTEIILENGAQLRINNNSSLTIERGATLRFEDGASIFLDGPNAKLEIDGVLDIGNNAVFTFTGDGYLITGFEKCLNCNNIVAGANSQIILNGNGKADKILEVKENTNFEPGHNTVNFELTNGKVILNRFTTLHVRNADYTFQNLDISSVMYTIFDEIMLNGKSNHIIENVEISQGKIGLNDRQIYGGGMLKLTNVTIEDCEIALKTNGRGAILKDCNIENNLEVWEARNSAQFFNSSITNSNLKDNPDDGVRFNSNGANLTIKNSLLEDHGGNSNVQFRGAGILKSTCSDFKDTYIGISVSSLAILDIDNKSYNIIEDNTIGISTWGTRRIDMKGGKNLFLWNGSSQANPLMFGNIKYNSIVTTPQTLNVNDNSWNSGGLGPQAADYNLKARWTDPTNSNNFVEQPLTLVDNSPTGLFARDCIEGALFDPCPTPGPPCSPETFLTSCPSCPVVNSPYFTQIPSNQALKEVLSSLDAVNPNYLLAILKLEDIITTPLILGVNQASDYIEEYAFNTMKEVYSLAMEEGLIDHYSVNNEYLDIIESIMISNTNPNTQNDTIYNNEKVYYTIQQALLKNSQNKYQEALNILTSIESDAEGTDLDYINSLECNITLIRDLLDSVIDYDTYLTESVACDQMIEYQLNYTEEGEGGSSSGDLFIVNIYPNPTSGQFNFVVEDINLNFLNVSIYTAASQLVISQDYYPSSDQYNNQIDISGQVAGIYTITFTTNNSVVTKSLVIQ